MFDLLFQDKNLMKWFISYLPEVPYALDTVSTMGSAPFAEQDLISFFDIADLEINQISYETDILIIGRENWDENELNKLLDMREGKTLKVYSQEMFFCYWITGNDPLEDEEIARAFGQNHKGLEYLSSCGFDWPTMLVNLKSLSLINNVKIDAPDVGVLKKMGYTVGRNGLSDSRRKKILDDVFSSLHLPFTFSKTYMKEWGGENSKARLQKMANSIAKFCINCNKTGKVEAVRDYEEDLKYLYQKYYTGRFKFKWPDTEIY